MIASRSIHALGDDALAEETSRIVQLATLAFNGLDLVDDELDCLCDAVMSHHSACLMQAEIRKGLAAADPLKRPDASQHMMHH